MDALTRNGIDVPNWRCHQALKLKPRGASIPLITSRPRRSNDNIDFAAKRVRTHDSTWSIGSKDSIICSSYIRRLITNHQPGSNAASWLLKPDVRGIDARSYQLSTNSRSAQVLHFPAVSPIVVTATRRLIIIELQVQQTDFIGIIKSYTEHRPIMAQRY